MNDTQSRRSPGPVAPNAGPRRFFRRWHAARRARLDVERIEHLNDHLLADIGLTRDGIRAAVRHGRPRG